MNLIILNESVFKGLIAMSMKYFKDETFTLLEVLKYSIILFFYLLKCVQLCFKD